jgi:hypothetical protein
MANESDDMRAADDLNRVWDDFVLGLNVVGSQPEPSVLADIARLAKCDDAPMPDAQFLTRLRADLVDGRLTPASKPSQASLGIAKTYDLPWPIRSGRRLAVAAAIAACLTLALSVGNDFLRDQANAPTVASVLASPAGTPTVGPTTTAWLMATRAVTVGHEVTLLPHVEATATGGDNALVPPSTDLTVLDSAMDGTGQRWLLVQTSDGRTGWLPRNETLPFDR